MSDRVLLALVGRKPALTSFLCGSRDCAESQGHYRKSDFTLGPYHQVIEQPLTRKLELDLMTQLYPDDCDRGENPALTFFSQELSPCFYK